MAKVARGALKVVGAVASVVAMIPGPWQAPAAAVAAVASVGSALLAKSPKPSITGSPATFRLDKNAGIPFVVNRCFVGGNVVHRATWGKDRQYQGFVVVYSGGGPIQGFEKFTVDFGQVAFNGVNAVGSHNGWLFKSEQLGACPEGAALASPVAGFPGWGAASKLSGYGASVIVFKYDTKEGKKWSAGIPDTGQVVIGPRVYDPRQDSTYPGGNGPCRALQEATYVGGAAAANPFLQALTYALGRWQNGKRVLGIGLAVTAIDVASAVECANVADANGWTANGLISSADDKWNVLKMMCQAGGGEPLRLGAKLSFFVHTPRVSLGTVTEADLVGRARVTAVQTTRNRINGVIPRYLSEAHGWEYVAGSVVRVASYVAEDGGEKTEEVQFPLVTSAAQAGQLAAYEIVNRREYGPIALPLKIHFVGYRPGDCLTVNIPALGPNGQDAIVRRRAMDPGTGNVQLDLLSETAAKHPFALGETTVPPDAPALQGPDPSIVPAPEQGAWLAAGGTLSAGSAAVPALVVYGNVDNPNADAVLVEYRIVNGTGEWISAGFDPPTVTRKQITAVAPNTAYEVAVSYRVRGVIGARFVLGQAITGDAAAGNVGDIGVLDEIYFGSPLLKEAAGGVAATLANFKTGLGTAAAIQGQGTGATANNLAQLNAAEGAKFGTIAPNAGSNSPLKVIAGSQGLTLIGNSVIKQAPGVHGSYDAGVVGPAQAGTCAVEQRIYRAAPGGGYWTMLALDLEPTGLWYADQWAQLNVYVAQPGYITWDLYVQGQGLVLSNGNLRAVDEKSTARLAYVGNSIIVFIDGVPVAVYSTGIAPGLTLYPKAIFYYLAPPESPYSDIVTGPYFIEADVASNIRDSANGNGLVSRTALLTALGTSAAIQGQGSLATKNNVNWSGEVVGAPMGQLAGHNVLDVELLAPDLVVDDVPADGVLHQRGRMGFNATGPVVRNVQLRPGPFGKHVPVLQVAWTGDAYAGFYPTTPAAPNGFNPDKSYRVSAWVFVSPGPGVHSFFSAGGEAIPGVPSDANRFVQGFGGANGASAGVPTQGAWYRLVGIMQGKTAANVNSLQSGIYDEKGVRVSAANDRRWTATTTAGLELLFYSGNGAVVWIADPRIEELSSAPSVAAENGTFGADLNSNIYDGALGYATVPRNEIRTSLGTAAGIAGQGTGATANNLSQLNATEGAKLSGIAPNAGSNIKLSTIAGAYSGLVEGNGLTNNTGSTGYHVAARTEFLYGAQFAACTIGGPGWTMVSFDEQLEGWDYPTLLFHFQYHPTANGGTLGLYVNGVNTGIASGLGDLTGQEMLILQDESFLSCFIGGNRIIGPVADLTKRRLCAKFHAYNAGETRRGFRHGPAPAAARLGSNVFDAGGVARGNADLITNLGTSAGIAGQGLLATRNRIILQAAEGGLASQANDVWLLDADIRTFLGTSAGFSGQAAIATQADAHVRVGKLSGATGRVSDPTFYNTQMLLAPTNTTTLVPSYSWTGSAWQVNLPAHVRKIAGPSGAVSLSYGATSGVVGLNVAWVAYMLDPNLTGLASPTVYFTTNPDDLLQPGAYEVSRGVSPAAYTADPPPPSGGGGGGGYRVVEY